MNKNLSQVLETKTYINSKNEHIQIHSETGREQCKFLQKIINENSFKNTLEVGCAFGISSAAILEEVVLNKGHHIIIDKFQTAHWGGNGIDLLKTLNYEEVFTFYEEFSYEVLPNLLKEQSELDFAYIDSTKLLDWLMVDFFFIDKMLRKDGVIVFDDVNFPGIRKLLRYIVQLPHYEVYKVFPENKSYTGSKIMKSNILNNLPKSELFIKNKIQKSDFDLGINAACVAFIKKEDDQRKYDWYLSF